MSFDGDPLFNSDDLGLFRDLQRFFRARITARGEFVVESDADPVPRVGDVISGNVNGRDREFKVASARDRTFTVEGGFDGATPTTAIDFSILADAAEHGDTDQNAEHRKHLEESVISSLFGVPSDYASSWIFSSPTRREVARGLERLGDISDSADDDDTNSPEHRRARRSPPGSSDGPKGIPITGNTTAARRKPSAAPHSTAGHVAAAIAAAIAAAASATAAATAAAAPVSYVTNASPIAIGAGLRTSLLAIVHNAIAVPDAVSPGDLARAIRLHVGALASQAAPHYRSTFRFARIRHATGFPSADADGAATIVIPNEDRRDKALVLRGWFNASAQPHELQTSTQIQATVPPKSFVVFDSSAFTVTGTVPSASGLRAVLLHIECATSEQIARELESAAPRPSSSSYSIYERALMKFWRIDQLDTERIARVVRTLLTRPAHSADAANRFFVPTLLFHLLPEGVRALHATASSLVSSADDVRAALNIVVARLSQPARFTAVRTDVEREFRVTSAATTIAGDVATPYRCDIDLDARVTTEMHGEKFTYVVDGVNEGARTFIIREEPAESKTGDEFAFEVQPSAYAQFAARSIELAVAASASASASAPAGDAVSGDAARPTPYARIVRDRASFERAERYERLADAAAAVRASAAASKQTSTAAAAAASKQTSAAAAAAPPPTSTPNSALITSILIRAPDAFVQTLRELTDEQLSAIYRMTPYQVDVLSRTNSDVVKCILQSESAFIDTLLALPNASFDRLRQLECDDVLRLRTMPREIIVMALSESSGAAAAK